jgi:F-type H+-transporting ATPase subunit c
MEWFPTLAEALVDAKGLAILGAGLGAALTVIGASRGIGELANSALQGQARQPEMAGRLFTTMLVAAALIEGFTFFSLIICLLVLVWLK